MAKFVLGGSLETVDMESDDILDLLDYDKYSFTGESIKFFDDDLNYTEFWGQKLTYDMEGGIITGLSGGTATRFTVVSDGERLFSVTGLRLSAQAVGETVLTGDAVGFLALLTSGNDTVIGSKFADTVIGGGGRDVIKAGAGNDELIGGAGADRLVGGAGRDTFVYESASDSTRAASGRDLIRDFQGLRGDRIDLESIDANLSVAGDQDFRFIGTEAFHGVAGELRYTRGAGRTVIEGDITGDGVPDLVVVHSGSLVMKASYFDL